MTRICSITPLQYIVGVKDVLVQEANLKLEVSPALSLLVTTLPSGEIAGDKISCSG